MARASSIEQLPSDILEQLQALLRDPRVTQLEATRRINAILEEEGHPDRVTKSAVNRYDLKMREVGERLRQSRQVAEMWIGKLGAAPQGQLGHLVNEMLRTLAFEQVMQLQDDAASAVDLEERAGIIGMLKELALTAQRLEASATLNVKRQAEIERQAREQALRDAAERVDTAAQARGLTAEDARFWREQVLAGM